MASVGMKSFYRQKKKGAGISKPSPNNNKKKRSDPITLIPSISPLLQEKEEEERLREFDVDMRYGPCIGLTRLERWARATSMGLGPPADVEGILVKMNGRGEGAECIWEGRV